MESYFKVSEMIISEIYNGFKISFDDKFSITITEEEARRLLKYLQEKESNGILKTKPIDPNVFKYFDCGEY